MPNIIKKHFPNNAKQWKVYSLIAFPVMFGALIYSLNGFIDNFMVGSIKGGAASLSAANTWSGMLFAVLASICATGSIFVSQYYNKGDFDNAIKIQKLRMVLCLTVSLSLGSIAVINPALLIRFALGNGNSNTADYQAILDYGESYIRIIAFTWIFASISMPASLSLSETGRGKFVFWVALCGLIMNIIGNYLLINVFHFGVKGAAYSTLASRITTFIAYQTIILLLKFELFINPLTLFKIGKNIFKQYFRRSFLLIFSSLTFILIEIRVPLFARAYPIGSIGEGAGAVSVFALTFAIMNIFLTGFSAISANAANFVGKELGKGNLKQALIHSDQLKGFNTSIAIGISLLFFGLTFAIPSFNFLAEHEPAKRAILKNVQYTSWVICVLYPLWVLLETSRINSLSGGKVNVQTIVDFTYGIVQIIYLIVLVYWVIPTTHMSLSISFLSFSALDVILVIAFEITYWKLNWNINITEEFAQAEVDISKDNYKVHISHE